MRYVVGSGWWASDGPEPQGRNRAGDDLIREARFHRLWYEGVRRYTDPFKIVIVDSASPVPPPLNPDDSRIEFISLDRNYGHATTAVTRLCGWTRGALMGAAYAWMCDADYFVYVEQDVLLHGEGIIEHAIDHMRRDFAFGHFDRGAQPLQQSLFIMRTSAFPRMLRAYDRIAEPDGVLSPEAKFARIRFDWLPGPLADGKWGRRWRRLTGPLWFDWLPFGYGRNRPIRWEDPYFYFQHGTTDEVKRYCDLSGLPWEPE